MLVQVLTDRLHIGAVEYFYPHITKLLGIRLVGQQVVGNECYFTARADEQFQQTDCAQGARVLIRRQHAGLYPQHMHALFSITLPERVLAIGRMPCQPVLPLGDKGRLVFHLIGFLTCRQVCAVAHSFEVNDFCSGLV